MAIKRTGRSDGTQINRAPLEYSYNVVRHLWGFTKVRFRRSGKNTVRVFTAFALAISRRRKRLRPAGGDVSPRAPSPPESPKPPHQRIGNTRSPILTSHNVPPSHWSDGNHLCFRISPRRGTALKGTACSLSLEEQR